MIGPTYTSFEMIERLVAFDTTSHASNLELIDFVSTYLSSYGVESQRTYNDSRKKANLFATIGPGIEGGVVLSAHTDVVPVDGQNWDSDPFSAAINNDKVFGRGTADMKSFPAIFLAMLPQFLEGNLQSATLKQGAQRGGRQPLPQGTHNPSCQKNVLHSLSNASTRCTSSGTSTPTAS